MKLVVSKSDNTVAYFAQDGVANVENGMIHCTSVIFGRADDFYIVDSVNVTTVPDPVASGMYIYEQASDSIMKNFAYQIPVPIPQQITTIQQQLETPQDTYNRLRIDPSATIAQLQQAKINALSYACTQAIYGTFQSPTTGHTYSFDKEAQSNFSQQCVDFLLDATATSVDWKTVDAGIVTHAKADFIKVATVDAKNHKMSNIAHLRSLVPAVMSATTIAQLDNIGF